MSLPLVAMDAAALAQISALLEANNENNMKQSEAMMQRITKENNAEILEHIGKATDDKIEKRMDALRQELAPKIAAVAEQMAKIAAAQASAPAKDPWQAGRDAAAARASASDASGSPDLAGSAAARAHSNK